MKINTIKLNCSRFAPVLGEVSADSELIYFRTPAVFISGGEETKMRGSSAVIFSSGCQRNFRPASPGRPLRYDSVSFRASNADRQYLSSLGVPVNVPVELRDDFVISGIFKCMKSHSMHKSRHSAEFMELSMRMLLITLSEAAEPEQPARKPDVPRLSELKALRESIYDDPMNTWSADELCAELGVSKAYFHRLYLAAFGVTCRQDVIESRLLYAAELLKNTDLSVSAVAEQCGYDSDSYFMRQFKQHKGCTPSEFRQSARQDEGHDKEA
jgi:AraC-like DNA-binding protein